MMRSSLRTQNGQYTRVAPTEGNHSQAEFSKRLDGVQGIVRVRLQITEFDLDGVIRFMEVRATQGSRGSICLRD